MEKALGLDGEQLVTPGGRVVGTLTVHRVRSLPMGQKEIMEAVDTLMWAESEGQRVAPKMEGTPQAPRQETNPWPSVPWPNAQWPNAPVRTVKNRSPPPGVLRSHSGLSSGGRGHPAKTKGHPLGVVVPTRSRGNPPRGAIEREEGLH